MVTDEPQTDCRFCSIISQRNGEDPIGTAGTYEHWLIVELPQPWSDKIWQQDPKIQPIVEIVKNLVLKHEVKLRVMAIAPDREYSQADYTRVLYYRRPQGPFAQFEKLEYGIPSENVTGLAIALLKQIIDEPNELSAFESYREPGDRIREILVCTHANVDIACGRFGYPIYKQLREQYASKTLRVWRCSHFGGHRFAPTLIDFPQGRIWGHLEPEILDLLIQQKGDVMGLYPFYRGWTGFNQLEQIAEREIWMQEGWDWLKYPKTSQVLETDESAIRKYSYKLLSLLPSARLKFLVNRLNKDINSAVIQIGFESPLGYRAYKASVEAKDEVVTAIKSGEKMELKKVKQYGVTDLIKIR